MRLLRDSFPFGALFGAPLTAIFRELVVPFLGGLGAVVLAGVGLGWLRGRRG
jgi:ABC-type Mn2+/Zn2+ transport system permease subunit